MKSKGLVLIMGIGMFVVSVIDIFNNRISTYSFIMLAFSILLLFFGFKMNKDK